jgi:hypothetical protein
MQTKSDKQQHVANKRERRAIDDQSHVERKQKQRAGAEQVKEREIVWRCDEAYTILRWRCVESNPRVRVFRNNIVHANDRSPWLRTRLRAHLNGRDSDDKSSLELCQQLDISSFSDAQKEQGMCTTLCVAVLGVVHLLVLCKRLLEREFLTAQQRLPSALERVLKTVGVVLTQRKAADLSDFLQTCNSGKRAHITVENGVSYSINLFYMSKPNEI